LSTLCRFLRARIHTIKSCDNNAAYASASTWDYTGYLQMTAPLGTEQEQKQADSAPQGDNWKDHPILRLLGQIPAFCTAGGSDSQQARNRPIDRDTKCCCKRDFRPGCPQEVSDKCDSQKWCVKDKIGTGVPLPEGHAHLRNMLGRLLRSDPYAQRIVHGRRALSHQQVGKQRPPGNLNHPKCDAGHGRLQICFAVMVSIFRLHKHTDACEVLEFCESQVVPMQ
jgi:hypothetical protein